MKLGKTETALLAEARAKGSFPAGGPWKPSVARAVRSLLDKGLLQHVGDVIAPREYVPEPLIPGWGEMGGRYNDRHLCVVCGCAYDQHLGGKTCPPTVQWGSRLPDVKFSADGSPAGIKADLEAAAAWWRRSGTVFKPVQ